MAKSNVVSAGLSVVNVSKKEKIALSAQDLADENLLAASVEEMNEWADEALEVIAKDDDPEFGKDLLVADMQVSPLTPVAMADSGPNAWTVQRALPLFVACSGEQCNRGAITPEEKVAWDDLAKTLNTHYDVFSFQAAMLWRVLEMVYAKSEANYNRLLSIPNHGFMGKNAGWMSCVLRVAKEHINLPHSTSFPGEEGFVPQNLTSEGRTTLRRLISLLVEMANIATCEDCGEWVGFDKTGTPFRTCKSCREAKRKADELADLNLTVSKKNEYLQQFEVLLSELSAAASFWVADEEGRGWTKARVAFDNSFKQEIDWRYKKVDEFKFSAKPDFEFAEKLVGFIKKTIDEIRTFKHLTYCPTCHMPTYPKAGHHGPTKPCEACQSSSRKAAPTEESDLQDLAEAAQEAGVGLTSADGQVLAVADETAPAFDPGGKYMDAWQRNLVGKEKDKNKKEKRERGEKKEKKVK